MGIISQIDLKQALRSCGLLVDMTLLDCVDSSNTWSQQSNLLNHLVVAQRQIAGRGRRDNQWSSLPGDVLFSYVKSTDERPPIGLSLVVGYTIIEWLQPLCLDRLWLKWPNDIVITQGCTMQKIGGILIEVEKRSQWRTIVGVGINRQSKPNFRATAQEIEIILARAAAATAAAMDSELCVQRFMQVDILQGYSVQFMHGNILHTGVVRGIDTTGALLVDQKGTMNAFPQASHIVLMDSIKEQDRL